MDSENQSMEQKLNSFSLEELKQLGISAIDINRHRGRKYIFFMLAIIVVYIAARKFAFDMPINSVDYERIVLAISGICQIPYFGSVCMLFKHDHLSGVINKAIEGNDREKMVELLSNALKKAKIELPEIEERLEASREEEMGGKSL